MHKWHVLGLAARQLSLPITLTCGQSFRWSQLSGGRWGGVVAGRLVLLRQHNDAIEFSPVSCCPAVGEDEVEKRTRAVLLDYFNSAAPLERLYEDWSRRARAAAQPPPLLLLLQLNRRHFHCCCSSTAATSIVVAFQCC
jgi:hypothetical protein